jgi:hypothetical protein
MEEAVLSILYKMGRRLDLARFVMARVLFSRSSSLSHPLLRLKLPHHEEKALILRMLRED